MKVKGGYAIGSIFMVILAMVLSSCGNSSSGSGNSGAESSVTTGTENMDQGEKAAETESVSQSESAVPAAAQSADDFHLTIEEAQQNAKMISSRSFLMPDGVMQCDNEHLGTWSKAMEACGGNIKMIMNDQYIDQNNRAHKQVDFSMYDDQEVAWICNTDISCAVGTDHRLLFENEYYKKIPEIRDAVAADEADRVVAVLHTDGTVTTYSLATDGDPSQYDWNLDLSCLTDIVQMNIIAISSGDGGAIPTIIGLKKDGTMVSAAGYPKELSEWTDIVAFSLGYNGVIGLKSDGTLVACGPSVIEHEGDLQYISEMKHIRWFDTGKAALSAVSDDGYAIGQIKFAPYRVNPDGSYDMNESNSIPDYEEWNQ